MRKFMIRALAMGAMAFAMVSANAAIAQQNLGEIAEDFERKALEMGVSARISYGWGPFRKTIKVAPPVPAVGEQGLQWQPDLSGAAPRTSRKAGAMIETRPVSDDQAGPPRTSRKMARRPADGERGAEVEDDRGAGPGPQHA